MLIPKHKRDVSEIDRKVLAMYSRGMSTRDISATIDDIYDFKFSAEQISKITDIVLEEQRNWQNRPLQHFYPFVFVDCLYVNVRRDYESKECAVYTILAYDINGVKDILGLWIQDTFWAQIFDEIKSRGIEAIGFISMDGLSGLEDAAKAIFHDVVIQRCIVHLIRNSLTNNFLIFLPMFARLPNVALFPMMTTFLKLFSCVFLNFTVNGIVVQ